MKGGANMPTKNPRITFMVSDEMMKQINDYKFEHRMKNQTQAILSLINIGIMELAGEELKEQSTELSPDDDRLLALYHSADPIYQSIVLELLENHPATQQKNRA